MFTLDLFNGSHSFFLTMYLETSDLAVLFIVYVEKPFIPCTCSLPRASILWRLGGGGGGGGGQTRTTSSLSSSNSNKQPFDEQTSDKQPKASGSDNLLLGSYS
jgi:hypothetical protein